MTIVTIISFILEQQVQNTWDETPLMGAIINGLMVVGVGTIGWAVINKAKEGDIWSAVSTGVLGGLALAFIGLPDFRDGLMEIVGGLVEDSFPSGGN